MAAGEVVLPLRNQYPAGEDEFLLCLFMSHAVDFPLERPAAIDNTLRYAPTALFR
jgi:hypothetical protein